MYPRVVFAFAIAVTQMAMLASPAEGQLPEKSSGDTADELAEVVERAFADTRDGWSVDEVILQDELNQAFVAACRAQLPDASAEEFNWTLLNLRKAGRLSEYRATRSDRRSTVAISHVGEMAARMIADRHRTTIDRIVCNPAWRGELDEAARTIDPDVDVYLARKAAFRLRKSRQLRPELITRIADWDRDVTEHSIESLRAEPDRIAAAPGIYIFRDATGYLYIGEAIDLRERLKQHLDQSDNSALAEYFERAGNGAIIVEVHSFDPASRIRETMVRRAYESELIRSRQPRFNIRP